MNVTLFLEMRSGSTEAGRSEVPLIPALTIALPSTLACVMKRVISWRYFQGVRRRTSIPRLDETNESDFVNTL